MFDIFSQEPKTRLLSLHTTAHENWTMRFAWCAVDGKFAMFDKTVVDAVISSSNNFEIVPPVLMLV